MGEIGDHVPDGLSSFAVGPAQEEDDTLSALRNPQELLFATLNKPTTSVQMTSAFYPDSLQQLI